MSRAETLTHCPSRGDRIAIIIFMLIGLVLVAWSAIGSTMYIANVVGGGAVEATVRFIDSAADVELGSSGSVPVTIDTATVTAGNLSGVAYGVAIASAVVRCAVVTAIVACLTILARNSLRGTIFSRWNTRLVVGAGMTALVGFGLSSVLDHMVGNEILLRLNDEALAHVAVLTAEPMPFMLFAFAFGIVATAYGVGARIQRETEGLA